MRDNQVIRGFQEHDRVINILHRRLQSLEKAYDKLYLNQLTSQMLWDVLMGLLSQKGIIAKDEFDAALKTLQEATQKAMEEEAKKKAEEEKVQPEGPSKLMVTPVSDVPAIPVV